MKKNRINLLINREDYQKYEGFFNQLKLSAAVLVIILFIIFLFFFLFLRNKRNLYDQMNLQKGTYLQLLTERRSDEGKINSIQKKYLDFETFLKDDASSAPYYQLLSDAIGVSSQSATLQSFEVNKDRKVSFTIAFSTFNNLMDFLKFAESPVFIQNFKNIFLNNFIIVSNKDKVESYELSFSGEFEPIKSNFNNEK